MAVHDHPRLKLCDCNRLITHDIVGLLPGCLPDTFVISHLDVANVYKESCGRSIPACTSSNGDERSSRRS